MGNDGARPARSAGCGLLRGVVALFVWCGALSAGCSQTLKPVFDPHDPVLVWPPPPAETRIRYVGQLASSANLKPPARPFQVLGALFVGAAEPDTLYGPRSAVCTPDGGRVWVADTGGRCLHVFNLVDRSYRKIERLADAPLLSPAGLCLGPTDSIFLCDSEGVAIYRLSDRTGDILESLRLPEDISRPVALSYDPDADELFVVDVIRHDIKVLARDGGLRRIIGRRGTGPGEFNFPCDIADDGERIWVVDTGNGRIQELTRAGEPVASFGRLGDTLGDLALPKAIDVDSAGNIYVLDARFENIQIFDREGRLLLFFGEEGTGPGEFWLPADIFIDHHDRIWICDTYNGRMQVFDYVRKETAEEDPMGRGLTEAGDRGAKGRGNGDVTDRTDRSGNGE